MKPVIRRWLLHASADRAVMQQVRHALPQHLYPVTWAPDAAAALAQCARIRFDCLLADYALPDMNGLLLLEQVRTRYPGLPVIILTAHEDAVLEVAALRKGAIAVVPQQAYAARLAAVVAETIAQTGSGESPLAAADRRADRISSIVLATMNEGCLVVDADGIITLCNPAAGRLLGMPQEKLIGRPVREYFTPETLHAWQAQATAVIAGVPGTPFEGTLRPAAGGEGPTVLVSLRSVGSELGGHEACLTVLSDITELHRTRTALRARLAELERFQRFFLEREQRIIELKQRLREYEHRLGLESPGLSDETRREIARRLDAPAADASADAAGTLCCGEHAHTAAADASAGAATAAAAAAAESAPC